MSDELLLYLMMATGRGKRPKWSDGFIVMTYQSCLDVIIWVIFCIIILLYRPARSIRARSAAASSSAPVSAIIYMRRRTGPLFCTRVT